MQQNHDPDMVVMGRKVYDELINRATWDNAPANHIKRHVSKFNSVIRTERKVELAKQREVFLKAKCTAQLLVNEFGGKTVYHGVKFRGGWFFTPFKLLGVGPHKITVKGRTPDGKIKVYHINQVTGDLPPNAHPVTDGYLVADPVTTPQKSD